MTLKYLARILSKSNLLLTGQRLWEANQTDWHLPLSKIQKLILGTYLILNDYSDNYFPPTFNDQQKAYNAEINYKYALPGISVKKITDSLMRKPFGLGKKHKKYLMDFLDLISILESIKVLPPQKLLELGCGAGWTAELLTIIGFDVVGTSISPSEIEDARTRIKSIEAKNLQANLEFRVTPMESVHEVVSDKIPFDAVFVFEALHHAYDWRQAIESSYSCLKSGGWIIIANEPNLIHTYVSYRVAKLSNTHEIGFARSDLIQQLRQAGFVNTRVVKNRIAFFTKPHWIVAQK